MNTIRAFIKAAIGIAAVFLTAGCGNRDEISPDTAFSTWISAYSGGMLQTDASIKIVFCSPVQTVVPDKADGLFTFSPAVKGSVRVIGDDTIEFIPETGSLKPGTVYKVNFRLGDIVDTGDPRLENFRFSFVTAPKEVSMDMDRMLIDDKDRDRAEVCGTLHFSEPPAPDTEMKMLSCSYPDDGYDIRFRKGEDGKTIGFQITGLERGEDDRELVIRLDGTSGGFDSISEEKVTIPSREGFRVLDARLVETADPYIDITFSQPVDRSLDPDGLFSLDGAGRTWTDISDNIVRLYFESFGEEKLTLGIASGIRSSDGEKLDRPVTIELHEDELKPAVEISLKGNILPDDRQLLLPLRAVNLRAIDLSVIRIYENNILSFLQDNELGDDNGLRRFGRLVCRKTIRLDSDPSLDLHRWNDFAIDLSGLFRQEPGAIYRIRATFSKDYSLYGKGRGSSAASGEEDAGTLIKLGADMISEEEQLVWDTPSPYYYESFYRDGYNWKDRDNPDTPTYYMMGDRFPYCNLMTSDIGVIAKSAGDGRLWLAVNNILTTAPVEEAEVTVYNYQLQVIGSGNTDSKGFAEIETDGVPFAVTVRSGQSVSYLKVTAGNERPLSRFDTGGQKLEAGLKSFIYGERGVWRPGDTLHVALMLDDARKRLPDTHPVAMELYTPQGQFYTKMVNTKGTDGLYVFNIPTATDDPTGTWNAYFKVGGSSFHKALMVETIKPNRLSIDLETSDMVLQAGKKTRFTLSAAWLTGPVAAGLDGKVEMYLSSAGKTFKGYEGYCFNDPTVIMSQSSVKLFENVLDSHGKAVKEMTMPSIDKAPGMMDARLLCTVAENGGDESITTKTVLFSPYPAYVGIKIPDSSEGSLETDTTYRFPVVVLDKEGKKVTGHRIEYRIFKMDWSWWWESKADELESYVNGSAAQPFSSGSFVSTDEPYEIPFRLDYPEWGRFLVYVRDLNGGHAAGGIFTADWPAYRGRSDKRDPDALTMLTFSTDRKEYNTGDEVTVYIPAADGGRALVSLENGSKIISSDWVETSGTGDTPYRFRVTEEMSPNFYVHISLLQKHGNTSNDLPVRMYGVQPVMVTDEASHLYPRISMPDAVRPLEEFTVRVSEKNRKKMTYTLAIVDEGLLDITAFRTPDPWSAMYAREALGVKTWDLYDNVVGAFGGRLSPMASIGGDQTINKESRQDNRFNPVVKFLGPFTLDGKENIHKVTLPMYVGSVRVMVVAGYDGAYGNAEKTVPVRTPLMVLPTLPRSLAPGEYVSLPVNVFAMEKPEQNVKVSVSTEGPVVVASVNTVDISFDRPGDRIVNFVLKTTGKEGTARVRIKAEGGGYTASETISVPVRNPNPYISERYAAVLEPGGSRTIEYGSFSDEDASAVLELASFPSMDIRGCLDFVTGYRYECTEQISARGIVLLSLKKFLKEDETVADSLVTSLLGRLYGRQLADGGFPLWPGQTAANEWVTSMAGQFMAMAAAGGYEVNKGVFDAWANFQKRCSKNYMPPAGALTQAYRLYSLALASVPENGEMNRLKEAGAIPDIAKWMLASAYAINGKKAVAKEIITGLKTDTEDTGYADGFGSTMRDRAIMLESLVLADDIYGALGIAEEISRACGNGSWYTTQQTAFVSSAMGRLADMVNTGALHAEMRYTGADSARSGPAKINSTGAVYSVPLSINGKGIEIKNLSEGPVYATVITRHRPSADAAVSGSSSGIGLAVTYTDLDGSVISSKSIRQGSDFKAEVTVTNNTGTTDLTSLALSIPVPSGWEIFNDRLFGGSAAGTGYDYVDIRDDRAIYYFDLPKGTEKTFSIRLRAAYKGEFVLPAISCEAMYSPGVNARTASGTTAVD